MAWATPPTYIGGDLISAADMNRFGNDLIYLKARTDQLVALNGLGAATVTLLPAGSVVTACSVFGQPWNETGAAAIGAISQVTRAPGGAALTWTNGTTTITLNFVADGSITIARSGTAITWGIRLMILYA